MNIPTPDQQVDILQFMAMKHMDKLFHLESKVNAGTISPQESEEMSRSEKAIQIYSDQLDRVMSLAF